MPFEPWQLAMLEELGYMDTEQKVFIDDEEEDGNPDDPETTFI